MVKSGTKVWIVWDVGEETFEGFFTEIDKAQSRAAELAEEDAGSGTFSVVPCTVD